MRRLVSFLLIALYLLANTGMVVGSHICGNETTFNNFKKSCACGKVNMPKGCCKDVKVVASNNFDQPAVIYFDYQFGHSALIVPSIFVYNFGNEICEIESRGLVYSKYEARLPSMPIYLLLNSFII